MKYDLGLFGKVAVCVTEEGFVVVIRHTKGDEVVVLKGSSMYVDPSIDAEIVRKLSELMSDIAAEFKLIRPPYQFKQESVVLNTLPKGSLKVLNLIEKKGFKNLPNSIVKEILDPLGFDTSNLPDVSSLTISPKIRDYSNLVKTDDEASTLVDLLARSDVPKYDRPKEFDMLYESIKNGHISSAWFVGSTGTGKTTLAQVLAYSMGAPLVEIMCNPGTTADELLGTLLPNENRKDEKDPLLIFQEGKLLKAYSKGYQAVMNEINFIPPEHLSSLNPILDGSLSITWYGHTYHRHPNFVLYVTSNAGYVGTNYMNPALKGRFGSVVYFPKLSLDEFVKRLQNKFEKPFNKTFLNHLYNYGDYIQSLCESLSENYFVTIRNAEAFLNISYSRSLSFEEFKDALLSSYVYPATMLDKDNYNSVMSSINQPKYNEMVSNLYSSYDLAAVNTGITKDLDLDSLFEEAKKVVSFEDENLEDKIDDIASALK